MSNTPTSQPAESKRSTSPFERPRIMTGYPLSPREKEHVERLVNEAETSEAEDEE